MPVAVRSSSSSVTSGSSHFGLPTWLAELLLRLAELLDLRVRELERLEEHVLGHLVRAGLDHRDAVLRADDDQVELGSSSASGSVGLTTSSAVDPADAHGADRARRTAAARA